MKEKQFNIVFRGFLLPGFERGEVWDNIKKLCKYDDDTLFRFFSGEPFIMKRDIDRATAERYKQILDRTGADCDIREVEAPPPAEEPEPFSCPKCNTEQEEGETCLQCGVIFAKLRQQQQRQAAPKPTATAGQDSSHDHPESSEPQDDSTWGKLAAHFAAHQEQAFVLKSFAMIAAILLIKDLIPGFLLFMLFLFSPLILSCYVRFMAAESGRSYFQVLREYITFMPVMYTEGEKKTEGLAGVTYSIIFLDILIYYLFETNASMETLNSLVFLPHEPNPLNVIVSAFSHQFLHAGPGHLWGNMLFLWAVGTVVEKRIGHLRFSIFYILSGLASGLLFVIIVRIFHGETGHLIGASGAISGVMGIFAIRCYFKSMVFPLPILGIFSLILPISLKIRLNSLVIIGLFFLADLSGGLGQIAGTNSSNIGHWAHIGGMLCGILLASLFRLGEEAIDERHMDIGTRAVETGMGNLEEGEQSLRFTLQRNPENAEAILMLAQILSKFGPNEEGEELYRKAIRLFIENEPIKALFAFREYYNIYFKGTDHPTLFRLAATFHREKDPEMATRCLEMLSGDATTPPALREKAMFQCARLLEQNGFAEAAQRYYRQFADLFPESTMGDKVRAKLA